MHVTRVRIENIRGIKKLDWDFRKAANGNTAGWHVVLGDNGAGKSTILRSIALALVGPEEAQALRQDWNSWLRTGMRRGSIHVTLSRDSEHDSLVQGRAAASNSPAAYVRLARAVGSTIALRSASPRAWNHVWGQEAGWFSASYGPFRRFTGGTPENEKLLAAKPRLARHLSVFGEDVALTESLKWLQSLAFKRLESARARKSSPVAADLFNAVRCFVNQPGFLPHDVKLKSVSSDGVTFVDGGKVIVPVEQLSDGFRSMLSMTFELIRQMAACFGPSRVFDSREPTRIAAPGVVLVDEIDAHLHPTWQYRLGDWFCRHFPNVQFIVTTHSPIICQAAENGTIWKLSAPGESFRSGLVTGVDRERLVLGNVLDAFGTGMFGVGITRSQRSKESVEELARLNVKETRSDLSRQERARQAALRAALPTAAPFTPPRNGRRR